MSDASDAKIAELEQALLATQELLAAILYVQGEPIEVGFDKIDEMRDIPNRQINIDETKTGFRFELVKLVTEDQVKPDA